MPLNPIDLLLVALVLIGACGGWRHGFLFVALGWASASSTAAGTA
jgi:uncharacterized membrane protein required for colicin V production